MMFSEGHSYSNGNSFGGDVSLMAVIRNTREPWYVRLLSANQDRGDM